MKPSPKVDIAVDQPLPARRSLRVALVTETYPPEINGVSLTVARMADGLVARRHEIQLVRLRQDSSDKPVRSHGREVVLMPGLQIPRYAHLRMGVPCTRSLVSLWSERRPDVVHIATEGPLGWSALQAATRLQLPVVSDFRTNFHAYSQHYGIGWLHKPILAYLRRFHNRTQRTMVPTESLRRELLGMGFDNLTVVARGVDTQLFSPVRRSESLRQAWGARPDTLVMLCVGRLAAEKNLATLREAHLAVRATGTDVKLVIVGDGPERHALQSCWSDAHFAGVQRGENLAAHYASADLFVFPSMTETFGNVVTEALASGLPMVAYDHAAAAELVQSGRNGLTARLGDRTRFVELVKLAARDLTMRQAFAFEARHTAMQNDWDSVIGDLELVLTAAIVNRSKATQSLVLRPVAG